MSKDAWRWTLRQERQKVLNVSSHSSTMVWFIMDVRPTRIMYMSGAPRRWIQTRFTNLTQGSGGSAHKPVHRMVQILEKKSLYKSNYVLLSEFPFRQWQGVHAFYTCSPPPFCRWASNHDSLFLFLLCFHFLGESVPCAPLRSLHGEIPLAVEID